MQDLEQDRELARRAAEGDESAWRTIYDATCDRLFSLLCYQVGDREEALDLLQDTYLRAHAKLTAYRGEAPLSVWLRRIALTRALDWKRSVLKRVKRTVAINETTAASLPEVEHVRFESEDARLQKALSALSPNQRAVLLLHDWEERSFEEIGVLLHCKSSTVRVHHARAREKMKKALTDGAARTLADSLEGQKI